MSSRVSTAACLAGLTAVTAVLAGCTSTAPGAAGPGDPITVSATDTSCEVSATTAPAGTLTFRVTNGGSSVTEFYLYGAGDRIMGEVENIGPGLSRDLVVEIPDGGTYTTACKPGMSGDGIRAPFTVTGSVARSTDADARLAEATTGYSRYVASQVGALVPKTTEFTDAVKAGDVARAKALYPVARTYWERIEPVAESFGDIDPKIDGREDDERDPGVGFTGFHRLEKDLWVTGLRPDSAAVADRLSADIGDLANRTRTVELTPVQLANGAKELLDEVATGKVTGEEDRYSHTDLWDFQANVEGSQAAVAALRPVIDTKDPALGPLLDQRFEAVDRLLQGYRAGDGYRLYTELTPKDVRSMTAAVDALSEPVSRVAGAGAALAGAAGVGGCTTAAAESDGVVPFRGPHQAGIVTPAQDRLHFVALDLVDTDRDTVRDLLRRWTIAAERMTGGLETANGGAVPANRYVAPADTGEALGLAPASLTLTFGIGPSLLTKLGLTGRRPPALADLPRFQGDQLDPARSGGDLCIQACADDPQVAVHAVRNLVRMGFGVTQVRWSQLGFGRTSSTSTEQATPRNLFGFKDGTNNIKAEEPDQLDTHVWVGDEGPDWMRGGSYLVARRIRMHIETWDRSNLDEQQQIVGRDKGEGAPLSGRTEFDVVDLAATGPDGPVIPDDSHVRLASAQANGGARLLRRGYNFVDGSDGQGHLDAGLFFIAFVRDPQRQYVPMQRSLSRSDAMQEYLEHTGSALLAVPPGLSGPDDYWGRSLLV